MTLFFSCSTEQEEVTSVVLNTPAETSCNPESENGFLGYVKVGEVGIVKVGEPISNFKDNTAYEVQEVEQIVQDGEGNMFTRKVSHLFYNMNEVMLLEMEREATTTIKSITTSSKYFYLENCIHVSSSLEELKTKFPKLSAELNFDDSMLYLYNESDPSITFMFTPDNILESKLINEIDGRVSIENINPEALIISIKVKN